MAKQPDYTGALINLGIFAGIALAVWFGYKWLKNHGSSIFGGLGTNETIGTGSDPGGIPSFEELLTKASNGSVSAKMALAYKKKMTPQTKASAVAYELSAANRQAAKFEHKAGTNVIINKALKAANALSDVDFMSSIREWQQLDKFDDFYSTHLAGAKITVQARSTFIGRFAKISGSVAGAFKAATSFAFV
jgi:hypothetical protein